VTGKVRWGLVSAANIANKFVCDMAYVDNGEIRAVAARRRTSAQRFGDSFGIGTTYEG
jgi:predicted dehydrogenase